MFGSCIKCIMVVAISGLLFSGCATKEPKQYSIQYSITYNSNPTGAAVVCDGVDMGYTPLTLKYTPNSSADLFMITKPCAANWISGAKADYTTKWDLGKFPNGVMQTLQRPNVNGYEKDAHFALKVRQMKTEEQVQLIQTEINMLNMMQNGSANHIQRDRNGILRNQNNQLQEMNNYFRYGY